MKNIYFGTSIILLLIFYGINLKAQISGIVFRDLNANGTREASATYTEPFIQGITVTAFPSSGTTQTTTTNSNGSYSFTGLTLPARIEFSGFLTDDYSGNVSSGNLSSVQFYSAATTTANFTLNYPQQYTSSTNPQYVVSQFEANRPPASEPLAKAMLIQSYNTRGNSSATYAPSIAKTSEIGGTWGIAYDRQRSLIYAAALVKRYAAMIDNNGDGKEDIGAIYSMTTSGSPMLWKDLSTLGIDFGLSLMPSVSTRNLPLSITGPTHDPLLYPLIGKIGIGGITLSDDYNKLYVMNLYDKKIYIIDVATKTLIGSSPVVPSNCTGGNLRPFGLKYHRGKVYVGTICDANTSQSINDLTATVYSFDGTTFTNILSFPLNYTKGYAFKDFDDINSNGITEEWGKSWNGWLDVIPTVNNVSNIVQSDGSVVLIYPQPLLVDIEFDVNESMILIFNDRSGHQSGYRNFGTNISNNSTLYSVLIGGDILRASYNSGNYTLENNATSGGLTTSGASNNQGPGGGEYYFGDHEGGNYHAEDIIGGSMFIPGKGQVGVLVTDPLDYWCGGVYFFNNSTGDVTSSDKYQLYQQSRDETKYGKANGLGDLEIISAPPPIEIGNRVWNDTDGDGIQDPNENPIQGVIVELRKSDNTLVATATTNASGNYYFSSGSGTDATHAKYNLSMLIANNSYKVIIPNVQGGSKQAALGTNNLTLPNVGGSGQPNVRDSDGSLVGNDAVATILTTDIPISGANNHTFDFGFGIVSDPCNPVFTSTTVQDVYSDYGTSYFNVQTNYPGFCANFYDETPITGQTFTVVSNPSTINFVNTNLTNAQIRDKVARTVAVMQHPQFAPSPLPTTLNDGFYRIVADVIWHYTDDTGLNSGDTWVGADGNTYNKSDLLNWVENNILSPVAVVFLAPPPSLNQQYEVIINPCPVTQSCTLSSSCTSTPQTSCTPVNGTASVSVLGGQGNITYLWSSGETTSSIANKPAGTYTVTVTDDFIANCTSTCQVTIANSTTPPVVSCSKVDNTNCATPNGSATATATGVTYLWSNGATTATISNLNAGNYTVTVTSIANACTATCSVTITNNTSNPTANCTPTPNSNCATPNGQATVSTNASNPTYIWSTGATTATITGLNAGTYTVTVTNTVTSCTNTCSAIVTNTSTPPTVTCAKVDNTNCATPNGSATATATGVTYLWSNGATTATISNLNAGNYTVTVTSIANACTATCSVTITNNTSNPTANCTPTPNSNCATPNGQAMVSTNASNPTYIWSTGATTATITGLSTGTYTVTITDGTSSCTNTCAAIVTSTVSPPNVSCSKVDNTNCATPNGSATATATGVTYLWSNGATTATISNLNAGNYTVTVTSIANACTATCSVTITNNTTNPSITCTPSQPTCAAQNSGSITTVVSNGTNPLTYLWSNGSTSSSLSNLSAGTYSVTVTDGNSCSANCSSTIIAPSGCCTMNSIGLIIGNCNNKNTLTNATDDEYTFTLNPTGTGLGTTYTVNGLPNSPIIGTYGSPVTFGPYLISGGVLNIIVTDNMTTGCNLASSVTPPTSCSVCNVLPPVLSVTDNICPSRTGSINIIQTCGSGTSIQFSLNNGLNWSNIKPLYSTTPRTIWARCTDNNDTTCKSPISILSTKPNKCIGNGSECNLIATSSIDQCNNNGTDNDVSDDYFTIQINATVTNGGTTNKYEVVVGADPLTGIGGNVLNSSGTNYGSPITVGNTKIFKADGLTSYQLIVRDINNNNCLQVIDISPVASCSNAPPKSPCHPVPCVPVGTIKN